MPRNAAFSKGDRVVIALGGNALGNTPEEQIARVRAAAPTLLKVIEQGNETIITHGNGPQVGMIQKAFAISHGDDPPCPPWTCLSAAPCPRATSATTCSRPSAPPCTRPTSAGTWPPSSPRSRSTPTTPRSRTPTKPIGQFLTREQADAEKAAHPEMTFVEDSGRGWRRVVASPQPKKIVEYESILNLLDNEFIVIACGGGGSRRARLQRQGRLQGIAAVIDKDMGGELLAEDCHADMLVLLTAVDHVAINFGKPDQEELTDVDTRQAREYLAQGQFGKGSMVTRCAPPSSSRSPAPAASASSARSTRPPRPWPASPAPASTRSPGK